MCIVHVRVQCSDTYSEVVSGDVVDNELAIESIVGTALLELFDTVLIEDVRILPCSQGKDEIGEVEVANIRMPGNGLNLHSGTDSVQ